MATNRFWLKIQNLEVPSRIYSNKIRLSLLATPKWPQVKEYTDLIWVLYSNHILFWAWIYITRWKLMDFDQTSKIWRFHLAFIATRSDWAFWRPPNDPKWPQMTKNTNLRWVCYPSHILFWANLCITRWKLIDFAKKSKIRRSRPTFIGTGAPRGFCS